MVSFFSNVLDKFWETPFPWKGAVTVIPFVLFFISKAWLSSVIELPEKLISGRFIVLLTGTFVLLLYVGFSNLKNILAFSGILMAITLFGFFLFVGIEQRYLVSKGYEIETSSDFAVNIFYPDFVRSKNSDE